MNAKSQKYISLFVLAIIINCSHKSILHYSVNCKDSSIKTDTITIVNVVPSLSNFGFLTKRIDSTHNKLCITNVNGKFCRKFLEFDIATKTTERLVKDTIDKQMTSLLKSLYHADEINTIGLSDSLIKSMNTKYVGIWFISGGVRTIPRYVYSNIPFYILI